MNMEESFEVKRNQNLINNQVKKKQESGKKESKVNLKDPRKVGDGLKSDEAEADGHGQDGPPLKKPKRKLRKPTAEEDIIDGFAILAFKNYEELSRAIKLGENSDSRICVQLLKRAEDGSVCKSVKEKKSPKAKNSPPKIKTPKPKTSPNRKKENSQQMANKLPGSGGGSEKKKRKSESSVGNPKKKERGSNGPASNEKMNNLPCESAEGLDKVSDGCTDLFATRKDSSPHLLDNLHSSFEQKGLDPQRSRINHKVEDDQELNLNSPSTEKNTLTSSSNSTSAATGTSAVILAPRLKSDILETSLPKTLTSNGRLNGGTDGRELNGHSTVTTEIFEPSSGTAVQRTVQQTTLFTPYATSAITRVSTPVGLGGSAVPDVPIQDQKPANYISLQASTVRNNSHPLFQQSPLSDFTLSGSHIHRSSSSPHFDKTWSNVLMPSAIQPTSTTPTKDTIGVAGSKTSSTTFGSIARLLDSPTHSSPCRSSPTSISASTPATYSTNHNNSLNQFYPSQLSGSRGSSSAPQSCSSRSLSPRSHSPPRERDSYSSNVSSLSRTSITPVSRSSSASHLPPNLSPLQNLSYSKAASWLSGVPPGLSSASRPTPPPPVIPPSSSGHLSNSGISSLSGTTPSPLSVFPGLVSGPHPSSHGVPSSAPISSSAMFAPPILPLSSIMSHSSSQPVPYGSSDSLFSGQAHNELVRRDIESRFLGAERMVTAGGPSQFLSRPGELHPHHQLLSHLSGVSSLSPHNQPGTNPAIFPPPMFKDLKLDSPFYRSLGVSYPGFNGMLPPPPNLTTPFTSPSQLPPFTPKKSGKWNAMHVRIAWEIYQHQQKGGSDNKNSPNTSSAPRRNSSPSKSSAPTPSTSQSSTDLLRPPNHLFPGINRPPDVGPPPPFVSPLLSPHQPPHRGHFDPTHPLFLHLAPHLGPSLQRYPGFGSLGPTFGGLSGLGSSLLGRDLANLSSLPSQEQWQRMQRGAPAFPGGVCPPGWSMPRPERDTKTTLESRRHKEERIEKRYETERHCDSKGSSRGDSSPFRDRSPVRHTRTPLENGDTDSRSSRSSDSHSTGTRLDLPLFS